MTTNILLVDDEPKTLLVSSDILRLDGYDVDTARDGREALEKFSPGRHSAVVTDIRMPGMSGIELVERIRERDQAVPIVILTGYATVETATRAVSAGAFEYLFKPIDFDKLKVTLRRAIERYKLVEENRRLVEQLTIANRNLEVLANELELKISRRTRDLAQHRDLLENVVESIPTGIAMLDASGNIVSKNAAFERLGEAGAELVRLLEPEIRAIAAGGPALRGREIEVGDAGTPGKERSLRIAILALAGGRILLVADDTTEAVRVEDELVQVEKLLSLGTLAGGIVHDLANPITAILGTAELLTEDPQAANRAELEAIVSAASYMRDVCSGLTEFSRRARKGEAFAIRVNEVVERALGFARYAKKLQGIDVETRLATDLPPVSASPSELIQVLVNLIVNACDAMVAGPQKGGRLAIATARDGRLVKMSIADTGPGIPEAVRARLFEPFFTTKGVGKGTGLGLYTARRIMKRLGGRIDLTTAPTGTTFLLELPAAS
jgi:C4-dicarboxylate-specific signal transduction histidine kinase